MIRMASCKKEIQVAFIRLSRQSCLAQSEFLGPTVGRTTIDYYGINAVMERFLEVIFGESVTGHANWHKIPPLFLLVGRAHYIDGGFLLANRLNVLLALMLP